uniref:Cation efflux protein transmembrane domain-containing protein n=1 Tax=Ditylenchus dipsaci TaxID=166011 RepID=A0A915CY06_9BILA
MTRPNQEQLQDDPNRLSIILEEDGYGSAVSSTSTSSQLNFTKEHDQQQFSRRNERVLIIISCLTFVFIIAELVGGYLGNSLAIMTDAFHMMSDLAGFLISILAIRLSRKKPTAKFSFGFHRAEVLGALASIFTIWALTGLLIYLAVIRIVHADYEIEPDAMMITASVGVCFNVIIGGLLYFAKTKKGSNDKSNSSISDSYGEISPTSFPTSNKNLNIRAAFIHALGDLVQSVGVLIASIVIKFTGYKLADPLCTFVFSLLVLMTTFSVFKDTILVLMEAVPSQINLSKICTDIIAIEGVVEITDMKLWSLNMESTAISIHLNVHKDQNKALTKPYHNLDQNVNSIKQSLVIVHMFENKDSAVAWSPSTQQSQRLEEIDISRQNLELGDWLDINHETGEINITGSTFSLRVINETFQIRAAVILLSEDLCLAPGFGRVGCFAKEMNFEKDQIYMAWITYNKYSTNKDLRRQLAKMNAEWVLDSQLKVSILQSELNAFLQANSLKGMQSVNGVVVSKDNETGSIYNPKHGVCDYQLTSKTAFNVGSFVHFIPIEDLFECMTALNISKTSSLGDNISVFSSDPDLKLSISNWNYNAQRKVVSVPGWERGKEVLAEVDDHINFYTPLKLGSQAVNENKNGSTKKDAETTKVVPPNIGRTESETDAVVVLSRPKSVLLFALKTDSPDRKFSMAKSKFEVEPRVGDWFRISLPTCEILRKIDEPVLQTVPISNELIKLHTQMKVLDDFVEENEVCGYSKDLGAIIDNANILHEWQLGKTIDIWVLSTSEINGAHWRIFSEKSKPQRQSGLRPKNYTSFKQSCSSLNVKETEDFKDISKKKIGNTSRSPFPNKEKSDMKPKNHLLKVVPKDVDKGFSIRTSGKSTSQSSLLKRGFEVKAVVTFVSPNNVFFYAVQSDLANPCIIISAAEFGDNQKPCMGQWFQLTMKSENDRRNIRGVPLPSPVLPSQVDKGKLMIKTKVKIMSLPKMASMNSSFCGYSKDLGPIVDNSDYLKPYQLHKTIDVLVQHCKHRDGSSWCIFNERLHKLCQNK